MRNALQSAPTFLLFLVAASLTGCPDSDQSPSPAGGSQPQLSASIQRGLMILHVYYDYLYAYNHPASAPQSNPTPGPPPSPYGAPGSTSPIPMPQHIPTLSADQAIPPHIISLVSPGQAPPDVPAELSTILQTEFSSLEGRLPADQAAALHGWSLGFGSCSDASTMLWSSHKANVGQPGGAICVSSFVVREVFIVYATGLLPGSPEGVPHEVDYLIGKGVANPFTYDGDSSKIFPAGAPGMTPEDTAAVRGALDGEVGGMGDFVTSNFTVAIDYLIAREIERTVQPAANEAAVSSAAWALFGSQDKTALKALQADLGGAVDDQSMNPSLNHWGVSTVGDGQQVLDAITQIAGPLQ